MSYLIHSLACLKSLKNRTCHQEVVGLLFGDLSMVPAAQEIRHKQQKQMSSYLVKTCTMVLCFIFYILVLFFLFSLSNTLNFNHTAKCFNCNTTYIFPSCGSSSLP